MVNLDHSISSKVGGPVRCCEGGILQLNMNRNTRDNTCTRLKKQENLDHNPRMKSSLSCVGDGDARMEATSVGTEGLDGREVGH